MTERTHPLRSRWFIVTAVGVLPALAVGFWLSATLTEQATPAESDTTPHTAPGNTGVENTGLGDTGLEDTAAADTPVGEFPELGGTPRAAGVWSWEELRGGECLEYFEGPFVEDFDVVACDQPHRAEFHRAALLDDDPAARYPGDQAVRDEARQLCAEWDLDELNDPERYDDLLVVPGYSIGEAQWQRGERLVGCFLYRESGEVLDDQLVG